MKITKQKFFSAGTDLNLTPEQIEDFWHKLENKEGESPFTRYLFYLGALFIVASLAWFLYFGFHAFGGTVALIASAYFLLFFFAGHILWRKGILGGLLMTVAVATVPVIIYGLVGEQHALMEIGTIIAGLIIIWFYPFPFLTAPIFCAAWLLSFELLGKDATNAQFGWVSVLFGLACWLISFLLDRSQKEAYAFWGYLFGTLAFWVGIHALFWSGTEPHLLPYALVNILLMLLSFVFKRTVFMVFGALGLVITLSYLIYDLFKDTFLFPFSLTIIGIGIIYLGFLYQKNRAWIEEKISKYIRLE